MWGRSKWVFAAVGLLYGALDRRSSPLAPALRSLVTVRVSQINHCALCVDINSGTLEKRGVPDGKIEALARWRESQLFDDDERLALEWAEAMTLNRVDDDLRQRLKARWSGDLIVEMTGLIAFQNLSSKFNAALESCARVLPGRESSGGRSVPRSVTRSVSVMRELRPIHKIPRSVIRRGK